MRRTSSGVVPGMLIALAGVVGITSPVMAQGGGASGPPDAGVPRSLELPELTRTRLANGVALVVVPNRESPLVSIDVIVPGGQASDPDGLEGVSLFTAELLQGGTTTREGDDIAEELARIGASFDATADADWNRISMVVLTDQLDPALDLLGDLIANPVFPAARLETMRRQARAALATQRSRPDALARRVMLREVYRGHPYGKQTTEATLDALDESTLRAHHERWYRPGTALVVVAGDVEPGDAARRLAEAFRDWHGGDAPAGQPQPAAVPSGNPGIVLVHQPGAVQADVRIGYRLPTGDADPWIPLEVAAHHLGATPTGLLHRRLREELGLTYSATATAERRVGPGVLEVAFATRSDVVVDAVGEALRLVEEVRSRPISDRDLAAAVSFLTGVIPLRTETPFQVADRIAGRLLLGLDPYGVEALEGRLRSLVPGEVRRAFAESVDPAAGTIVVVGDARTIHSGLSGFGAVRVERPDGTPLTMEELEPVVRSRPLSAERLAPSTLRYRVTLQGRTVGDLTREIVAGEEERTVRSRLTLGPQTMAQSVTFGADDFDFRESSMTLEQPGVAVTGEVRRVGASIVGSIDPGVGPQAVEIVVPPGVVVSDMLEVAVWLSELDVGTEIRLPVANISNGTVGNATVRVEERAEVTVPAGTFDVFRVVVTGAEEQTMWVRTAPPHLPIRVEPGGQPIVVELVEIREGPAGAP